MFKEEEKIEKIELFRKKIANNFPELNDESEDVFDGAVFLRKKIEEINPDREILKGILSGITQNEDLVTNPNFSGYSYCNNKKGRIINQIRFMKNWKLIMPLALGLIIVALIGVFQYRNDSLVKNEPSINEKSLVKMPEPTGDLDKSVDAFIAAAVSEQQVLDGESSEIQDLAVLDNQIIGDLENAYDEKDF